MNRAIVFCVCISVFSGVAYGAPLVADKEAEDTIRINRKHKERKTKNLDLLSQSVESYGDRLQVQEKLAWSSVFGDDAKVKELLKNGAQANFGGVDGKTALHLSAQSCKSEVVKTLLEAGASADLTEQDGNTALHHAVKEGCVPVVKYLKSKNAKYNIKNASGKTALNLAEESVSKEILNILTGES